MYSKLSRPIFLYFLFSLGSIIAALSFGTYYFWNKGIVNVNNMAEIFEASQALSMINKNDPLDKINQFVDQDDIGGALKLYQDFESLVKSLNSVEKKESYYALRENMVPFKKALSKLVSSSSLEKIMSVFDQKLESFKNFSNESGWRTLSRVSSQLERKLTNVNTNYSGGQKIAELDSLKNSIQKDIFYMETVTNNSVLSAQDKSIIAAKLATLKTEIKLLSDYISSVKELRAPFSAVKDRYSKWVQEVDTSIGLRKIGFESGSRLLIFSTLGLLLAAFVFVILGIALYRFQSKRNLTQIQNACIDIVKNGILPIDASVSLEFNDDFKQELNKLREYVHKRMSFGTLFQDAVPFSTLMLDSNLNLVWANSMFIEMWDLKNYSCEDDKISWDFLQRFTNLGEHDPILMAVNDGVAGIYQIQVKTSHNGETQPFEMYVSPVEYAAQKRIIIFFYPLKNMEETLQDQSTSLVGPVARTLDALSTGVFNQDFVLKIAKDFDIAGINHIFEKFKKYNTIVTAQIEGMTAQISSLESDNMDHYKFVDDMISTSEGQRRSVVIGQKKFKDVKDSIISNVEMRSSVEQLYIRTLGTAKDILREEKNLLMKAIDLSEMLQDNQKAFLSVEKLKKEFKSLRPQVDQFKTRLVQLLEQSMIFQKSSDSNSRLDQSLGRIKNEVKNFEKTLLQFSQITTGLDVGLSKLQIILERNTPVDLQETRNLFNISKDQLEQDGLSIRQLAQSSQESDEDLIRNFKSLVENYKEYKHLNQYISELAQNIRGQREKMSANNGKDVMEQVIEREIYVEHAEEVRSVI